MPKTDETNPNDWLRFARDDLQLVDLALQQGVASPAVLAKLVEALEKFLKAFLIAKGWRLVRSHDVEALLMEATRFEPDLKQYIELVEPLAEAYFEDRYPGFDISEPDLEAIRENRAKLGSLFKRLEAL